MITPLPPNSMIRSRYLIVQMIGQGTRGDTYLAVDQREGSAVALKRTNIGGGDAALTGLSEREAVALTRLNHPVLPKVKDHFIENGHYFLVMEHISGENLSTRLEIAKKPFPVSWVMFWADQLLDALNYLHSHVPPIYHGDVNPRNLKLTADNHIILLDHGLSAGLSRSADANPSLGSDPLIIHFPSPEQLRGAKAEAAGDVYSLSATLYQLITNSFPSGPIIRVDGISTSGADPLISPADLNHDVPRAVAEVIIGGMALRPGERYSSAVEMQRELRRAFNLGSVPKGDETAIMPRDLTPTFQTEPLPTPATGPAADPMDATINMVSDATEILPRQSDVKTEVIRVNDTAAAEVVNIPPPTPHPASPVVEPPGVPLAAATVPDPYPSQVTQIATAKKSSSKAGLMIGIAAVLLLLVVVAAGGGWFVYTRYYLAQVPEATPTPQPPQVTPTPPDVIASQDPVGTIDEPTPEVIDPDAGKDTTEATPDRDAYVPPPRVTVRNTPERPSKPPPVRTPKPPPARDDRTVILQ